MEVIEEIIMTNFYNDYEQLAELSKNMVCFVGVGYNNSRNIFYNRPQIFLLENKADFSFEKIQVLLERFENNQILLGIKLAFIDEVRIEEDITRIYQILNKKIRCI